MTDVITDFHFYVLEICHYTFLAPNNSYDSLVVSKHLAIDATLCLLSIESESDAGFGSDSQRESEEWFAGAAHQRAASAHQ